MTYANNFNPIISDVAVFDEIVKEKKSVGYYDLPFGDTSIYKDYAKRVKQKNIVVVGIGGSTLGAYAIYKFLKQSRKFEKKLIFLETTDPIDIKSKLDNTDLKDTLFIVISKSGTTVETVAIFKYINFLVKCDRTNTIVVTQSGSRLDIYAQANDIESFDIPENIGGRFSVFCAVGLLPLAIVGVDIDELLSGAKQSHDSFFDKKEMYKRLFKKSRFLVEYKNNFNINVVFSYSSRLEGFNKWYIQLWGESLGKVDINSTRQGLTPVGIIGPVDQHSFLQLIIEGKRDKTVTIIKIEDFDNHLKIPSITLQGLDELNYLNDLEFSSLIKFQADATIESIGLAKDIPYDVITIESISEGAIAGLMYEYELLTSLCAKMMYINAYNQPGVENGKIILKNKLQG